MKSERVLQLVAQIESGDLKQRALAARDLGEACETAIPALARAMLDAEPFVVRVAKRSLYRLHATAVADALSSIRTTMEAAGQLRTDPISQKMLVAILSNSACEAVANPGVVDPEEQFHLIIQNVDLIGELGERSAIPALCEELQLMLYKGDESALHLARALWRLGGEDVIPTLLGALENPGVRPVAAEALAASGRDRFHDALLARLEPGQSDGTRAGAAYVSGKIELAEAVPLIRPMLGSDSSDARYHAIRALGSLRDTGAVKDLLRIFRNDPESCCRSEAAKTLAAIGDRSIIEECIVRIRDARRGRPEPDRQLFEALGDLNAVEAVPTLMEELRSSRYDTPGDAAIALAKMRHEPAIQATLRQLGNDGFPLWLQLRIAELWGDAIIAPMTEFVLSRAAAKHRAAAAKLLGRIKATSSFETLARVIRRSESVMMVAAACRALGDLGCPGTTEALLRRRISSEEIDLEIIQALAKAAEPGDEDAIASLQLWLTPPMDRLFPAMLIPAAYALTKLGWSKHAEWLRHLEAEGHSSFLIEEALFEIEWRERLGEG